MSIIYKKFCWTQESTRDLIELYKKHPVLYVTKDGNYKNKIKRLEALKVIRNEMMRRNGRKITIEDIKKKIHGLRTQYSHQLAKIRKSQLSDAQEEYQPTLWCFTHLDFLRHTAAIKNVVSSMGVHERPRRSNEEDSDSKNPQFMEECEVGQEMGTFCDDITVKQEEITPPRSPVETSVYVSTSSSLCKTERRDDDLTTFGKLVELELRNINNPHLLRKAKREILNILMEAQESCDN